MFAYNPTPDRSAEILARANENAAAIQLRSMENLGDSLAAMGESAAQAYSKASENQMTASYLDAMAGELSVTKRPDGTPYVTSEELEIYSKAPLNKKTGMVAAKQAQRDYDMRKWMIDTQYNLYPQRMAMMNQRAANQQALRQPAPNQVPMGYGATTGQPATTVPFNVTVPINP